MALVVAMRRRVVLPKSDSALASISSANSHLPAKDGAARPGPQKSSPWPLIFAADLKHFVANLRHVNCPEETVKDIVVAEINRRFAAREENLRPTPGDHVPLGWGGNLTELK